MVWTVEPRLAKARVWLQPPEDAPLEMLAEWIEESYRSVAAKALLRTLDASAGADHSASTQEG